VVEVRPDHGSESDDARPSPPRSRRRDGWDDDWGWDDGGAAATQADDEPEPADDADESPEPEEQPRDARRSPDGAPARRVEAIHVRRRLVALAGLGGALLLLVAAAVVALGGGSDGDPHRQAPVAMLAAPLRQAADDALGQLRRDVALRRYARLGLPVYCGGGKQPWVALTLDDGPWPLSPKFIALLAREKVPVTVFRIGRNVPGREEYVRVQRNLGWESGSHTLNHPALGTLSRRDQREEIVKGEQASTRVLGRPPMLFRPPYESHDATTDRILRQRGRVEVLWNVDTQDALRVPASTVVERAVKGLHPGSIILMHEVQQNTLEALPRIIAEMRRRDLKPVTVSEMLAGDPPSEAQLRKGFDGCPVDLTPGRAAS